MIHIKHLSRNLVDDESSVNTVAEVLSAVMVILRVLRARMVRTMMSAVMVILRVLRVRMVRTMMIMTMTP